ncbi:glutathione S-transferase family protein [Ciceribacter sp. L1K23]|uniref:glutathione S-transferase family protein n=1 Tax=Ciceribacter sp. L1K23 TaxID=2820276 RepID=UPI001B838900|nr:glutathione S-transferase family protein [Ciceribacter sp. L1K23]MBR0556249.1 glutathione S-transferase family protein [Ciceribacter sp. L1K23]
MDKPRLFGADYSVYVRSARLALHEKGVDHDLISVDVFPPSGPSPEHLVRHPFGKIPVFEHDGFRLYETGAITRYIDEAFAGPALQPSDPQPRARMNQVISIADGYLYPHLVWGLYVELVSKAEGGELPDTARLERARELAPVCLKALSDIVGSKAWFAGESLSLADLHVAPMIDYLLKVPEGRDMFAEHSGLVRWWERMTTRDSFRQTLPTI